MRWRDALPASRGVRSLPHHTAQVRNGCAGADEIGFDEAKQGSFHDRGQNRARTFALTHSLGDGRRAAVQARAGAVSCCCEGRDRTDSRPSLHGFARPDGSPERCGWRAAAEGE